MRRGLGGLIVLSTIFGCGTDSSGDAPDGAIGGGPSWVGSTGGNQSGGSGSLDGAGGTASGGAASGGAASGGTASGGTASGGSNAHAGGSSGGTGNLEDSCDELSCEDWGVCHLRVEGDECVRVCQFELQLNTTQDLSQLTALRCHVIEGSLRVSGSEIEDLKGLETIREITNSINATGVASLISISLPALQRLGGFSQITDLEALTSIEFPALEDMFESTLYVLSNPVLQTIQLDALATVGQLTILDNPSLVSTNRLPSLTTVEANLFVAENPSLPIDEVDDACLRVGCTHCLATDTTVCN